MQTLLDRDIDRLVFEPPELGCVLYSPGLPGSGSRIYDRSPYGEHGAITGATWARLPSGLWYLKFDGLDDGVVVSSFNELSFTAITVKLWVKIPIYTVNNRYIATWTGTPTNRFYIQARKDSDTLWVAITTADSEAFWASSYAPDVWCQLGFVWNGTKAYKIDDGSLGSEQSLTGILNPAANLQFGIFGEALPFDGSIALPEIIRGAWNDFDVQDSFEREKHLFGVW